MRKVFSPRFHSVYAATSTSATASAAEISAWSIKSHQTNNSILLKMWKGICNIKKGCASQPAVSGDSDDDSGAHDTAAGPEAAEDSDDDGALEKRRHSA
ncbi:hypothetical protein Bca52824_073768 [Brassica carinata]|uniref:Uncharacterized protein n=1 Tax=Brassica carinata TaxID=52824 RepID=A0A8X7QAI6_BRACI|nr:hypothetical protein Bca52824_073768 [Brassica carinata]